MFLQKEIILNILICEINGSDRGQMGRWCHLSCQSWWCVVASWSERHSTETHWQRKKRPLLSTTVCRGESWQKHHAMVPLQWARTTLWFFLPGQSYIPHDLFINHPVPFLLFETFWAYNIIQIWSSFFPSLLFWNSEGFTACGKLPI